MITILAILMLVCAAFPCCLFLWNLTCYRRAPGANHPLTANSVSLLIPARNEEKNIVAAVRSALASPGLDLEVLVLDDHSTDRTADLVAAMSRNDPRVRLVHGNTLPPGWCGKQHACHILAAHAQKSWLVFMDADVRLEPNALVRMAAFMEQSQASLGSGVPRQLTGSPLEKILIPLIHFVLLAYLPIPRMRRSTHPAYAAGCGQLFIARRSDYHAMGGHASIRDTMHDGIKLPRAFRKAGFKTDLFDATDLATCRMYHSDTETWQGLAKNATEGLGAPGVLVPMSALLGLGQIAPFVMALGASYLSPVTAGLTATAVVCAWLPRWLAACRFRQSWWGALLHPVGTLLLIGIQWQARWRQWRGRPSQWRGRSYQPCPPLGRVTPARRWLPQKAALWIILALLLIGWGTLQGDRNIPPNQPAKDESACPAIELSDQFNQVRRIEFPKSEPTVLLLADWKGSKLIEAWITAVKEAYPARVDLVGIADVQRVPFLLRSKVLNRFRSDMRHRVLLDWSGDTVGKLMNKDDRVRIVVVDSLGAIQATYQGPYSEEAWDPLRRQINSLLDHGHEEE